MEEPVQVRCVKKWSLRLYQRIEAEKLQDTQGKVQAEPRLYALTNRLGEIKAEIILRESRCRCADQGTYQHDEPKFRREEG